MSRLPRSLFYRLEQPVEIADVGDRAGDRAGILAKLRRGFVEHHLATSENVDERSFFDEALRRSESNAAASTRHYRRLACQSFHHVLLVEVARSWWDTHLWTSMHLLVSTIDV
jgi:hypothetical protein